MVKVYIDAGHGGKDSGTVANGLMEKELTLEAALYQQKRFQELGVSVSMTRTTDIFVDSSPRSQKVKASGAKICISNHFNAGGGEGVETIYSVYASQELATLIAKEIHNVGQPLRYVYNRKGDHGDYYYMHRQTGSVETVIVEYGFLDNLKDVLRLRNKAYREKMYEAVVKATCAYLGVSYLVPSVEKQQPNPSAKYFVQIGAFAERALAQKMVEKAKRAGFSACINQKL